ncbi:MAG: hypothetical protein AAF871_11440 [Pseudomonadota bacterium]
MRILLRAAVFAGLALPAQASQPISESLTECAAIYQMSAEILMERRPDVLPDLLASRDAFRAEATALASKEGHRDAKSHVAGIYRTKVEKWNPAHPVRVMMSEDYKDWAKYCRALGKNRGLAVPGGRR